jgi:hypothetical protein
MGEVKSAKVGKTETGVVRFWSPENEKLIIGGSPVLNFTGFRLMVKTPSIIKRLEEGPGYGKLYYKVHDKASEGESKVEMMKFLNRLLDADRDDQVREERGIMSVFALFEDSELAELGISRSAANKEKLILAALERKTIEGV